jgi:hypothetical protein
MKKIGIIAGISSLLIANYALAGWSAAVTLTQVETSGDQTSSGTYLGFSSTPTGKPSCGTSGQGVLSSSADGIKSMTNLATAALLSGRSVRIDWDGTCSGTYARIVGVILQ